MTIQEMLAAYAESWVDMARQRDALGALLEQIPGVGRVFRRIPAAIQSDHCPVLVLVPKPAQLAQETARHLRATRQWELRAFIAPVGTNTSPDELEAEAEPWLDLLPLVLQAYPVLRLDDGRGFNVVPLRASEVQQLTMAAQSYVGGTVEFQTVTQSVSMIRLAR